MCRLDFFGVGGHAKNSSIGWLVAHGQCEGRLACCVTASLYQMRAAKGAVPERLLDVGPYSDFAPLLSGEVSTNIHGACSLAHAELTLLTCTIPLT